MLTYRCKLLNFLVRSSKGSQAQLLRELGKSGLSQQRCMTKKLMDGIPGEKENLVNVIAG